MTAGSREAIASPGIDPNSSISQVIPAIAELRTNEVHPEMPMRTFGSHLSVSYVSSLAEMPLDLLGS